MSNTFATPTHDREAARAARIAAAKAARAEAPKWQDLTVTVADLRVGDVIVLVPVQQGVRGLRFDPLTKVADLTPDFEAWRFGKMPVKATAIRCSTGFQVSVPDSFAVDIRRPVA